MSQADAIDVIHRADPATRAPAAADAEQAVASAERSTLELIERASLRERGQRLLMEVKAARGNLAEALQTYEDLRRTLREELGIAPGPATQRVHMRLLQLTDQRLGGPGSA